MCNSAFLITNVVEAIIFLFIFLVMLYKIITVSNIARCSYKIHFMAFIVFSIVKLIAKSLFFIDYFSKAISIAPTIIAGCSTLILQTCLLDKIKYDLLTEDLSSEKKQKILNNVALTFRAFIILITIVTIFCIPSYTNSWNFYALHEFIILLILALMVPSIFILGLHIKEKVIPIFLICYIIARFISNLILSTYLNFNRFYDFDKTWVLYSYIILEGLSCIFMLIVVFKGGFIKDDSSGLPGISLLC